MPQATISAIRLFRGLREPYDSARVGVAEVPSGTDFTDCPHAALVYASGRKGVLLVLDVPDGAAHVSEEDWGDCKAKRLMVWGKFDKFIVAEIPAKELRAEVRRKSNVTATDVDKSWILRTRIAERLEAVDWP